MPFRIDKKPTGYRLYNLDKKRYAKPTFKTRQSALNAKRNYMSYDSKLNPYLLRIQKKKISLRVLLWARRKMM